jgi:hypothetical protein
MNKSAYFIVSLLVASACALPPTPRTVTVKVQGPQSGRVLLERVNPAIHTAADLQAGVATFPNFPQGSGIQGINIHITADDYQPYDCYGAALSPRGDYLLTVPGGHCQAMALAKAPARSGVVDIEGRALRDAQGPLHGLGLTFFWAYQGQTTELDRFIANLDWTMDSAAPWRHVDYVRILGQVDWPGRDINPADPRYEANLGATIDTIYDHCRCRVEISLVGGPLSTSQALDLTAHVVNVINTRLEKVVDLEMVNEAYNKATQDTMILMVKYVRAHSSVRVVGLSSDNLDTQRAGLQASGGSLFTQHSDRDAGDYKWRQVRQMQDCHNGPYIMAQNEPPGPHSSIETNDSPLQLAMMRATAHMQGCALWVFHVGDMVMGIEDANHGRHANLSQVVGLDAMFQAIRNVDPWIPDGVENWTFTNQHGSNERVGPHPLLADGIWSDGDDHGVNRAYGAVGGNNFVEVLLGVKDYVNVKADRAMAFDVFEPVTKAVLHFDLGAGQSAKLAGRADTMEGYIIRGSYK